MFLFILLPAMAGSLNEDRVDNVEPPDEQGRRLYGTDWSILASGKKTGSWHLSVNTLPWIPAADTRPSCTVFLAVGPPADAMPVRAQCTDSTLDPLVLQAAQRWEIQPIHAPREVGELQIAMIFSDAEEDPTVMRGVIATNGLRQSLTGGQPSTARAGNVIAKRRIEPSVPSRVFDVFDGPFHCEIHFFIDKRGRPIQINQIEAPKDMWKKIQSAGWRWRFTLPEGSQNGRYFLKLTIKQGRS